MYVDPFFAGVVSTIFAECLALIVLALLNKKK